LVLLPGARQTPEKVSLISEIDNFPIFVNEHRNDCDG